MLVNMYNSAFQVDIFIGYIDTKILFLGRVSKKALDDVNSADSPSYFLPPPFLPAFQHLLHYILKDTKTLLPPQFLPVSHSLHFIHPSLNPL